METRTGRMSRAAAYVLMGSLAAAPVVTAAEADAPLVAAAKAVDVEAVRTLLQRSADVQASLADGMTALHWAVQRDAVDIVSLLVGAGADVSSPNRYGVTPLTLGATNGHARIVARLLAAGADPNTRLAGGETVLMTAARTGQVDVLEALLASGADPNAFEETRGQTALMWAAAENNVDAIVALVAGGAAVSARTGDLAANEPAGTFSTEVGLSRSQQSGPSFTALLFAVQLGQMDAVRTLLDLGANVDDAFPDGTSALVLAAMNGQHDVGVFLVDRGADVNAATQGWSALHQIIRLRRTLRTWQATVSRLPGTTIPRKRTLSSPPNPITSHPNRSCRREW